MYNDEELINRVINCAYNVHQALPPGYYERVYHRALMIELADNDIPAKSEVSFDAFYKGQFVGDFRVDILVNQRIIVEIKAVEKNLPQHEVQLVHYLNMANIDSGLLINFGSYKFEVNRKFRTQKSKTN